MFEESFSKFAFIFLVYAVISGGYINEMLSCQMRNLIINNKIYRNLLGVLLVFVFIMLEGGWSFGPDEMKSENDWSSGNIVDSVTIAFIIYAIFLISAKSKLVPNLTFFGLVFLLYIINTHRSFLLIRNRISKEKSDKILKLEYIIVTLAIITLIYGFIDYLAYQKKEYSNDFSWVLFLFGTKQCKSLA